MKPLPTFMHSSWTPVTRRLARLLVAVYAIFSISSAARADSYLTDYEPTADFGAVDQYDPSLTALYAGEACVPTSQTNSLVFLEKADPAIVGTSLTGPTYNNYISTDLTLASDDGTSSSLGTYYISGTIGLHNYLSYQTPNVPIYQNATYSTALYGAYGASVPSYISFQNVTPSSIYSALSSQNALYLGLSYSTYNGVLTSGGHSIEVEGINWDASTFSGLLSFIDPLDPGANFYSVSGGYANGRAIAPVVTTGSLTLDPSNPSLLMLTYDQYEGGYYSNGLPPLTSYSLSNMIIGYSEALSPAPEPSAVALLCAGMAFLLSCFKDRRIFASLP